MKNIIIIIALYLSSLNMMSQDYKHSVQGVKKVKILSLSGVSIMAYDKNELLIIGKEQKNIPEKAKGLKAVYSGGTDNTGLGISIEKEGELLILKNLRNIHSSILEIYLPKDINIAVENKNFGRLFIDGFSSEIEAKTNVGKIKISNVTGPVIAESSAGGIEVVFNKVNQSSPISILSSVGDIDVKLPSDTPTDISLRASIGEIYTDFEIKNSKENNKMKMPGVQKTINTKINNGGVNITLRTSTGNIYLRKK